LFNKLETSRKLANIFGINIYYVLTKSTTSSFKYKNIFNLNSKVEKNLNMKIGIIFQTIFLLAHGGMIGKFRNVNKVWKNYDFFVKFSSFFVKIS